MYYKLFYLKLYIIGQKHDAFGRRCKKADLKRIAKATGATFVPSLANLEGEESFEASYLGKNLGFQRSFEEKKEVMKGSMKRS